VLDLAVDAAVRGALGASERARLRRRVARMVKAAWLAEGGSGRELEVALRLTDDPTIHALNREYRRKDRPTDVLAFALREGEGGALHPHLLGDLVISVDTARRQARRRGLAGEILFLAAHGLCHLLGYDHRTDAEEAEMNARMAGLLAEAARRGPVRAA
jgi:probable rRNA maturation factor